VSAWGVAGLVLSLSAGAALCALVWVLAGVAAREPQRPPSGMVRLTGVELVRDEAAPNGAVRVPVDLWVNPSRVTILRGAGDGGTLVLLAGKVSQIRVSESPDEVAALLGVRVVPGAAGRPAGRIRLAGDREVAS
jgi:hypothetical protein